MDKKEEYALQVAQDQNIKFVRLWFTDVLGFLKSIAIAPAELENSFAEGIGFDGSSVEGFTRITEFDMIAKPDASTFQILPWRGDVGGTARMFCDILTPNKENSLADSRYILKRSLSKVLEKGLTFYAHPEIEFYLFKKPKTKHGAIKLEPIDYGGYFDHVPRSIGQDFRRDTITTLEKMGISVEFSHHEIGPGQNEIDLRHADALTCADNIISFRTVVKEIALQYGMVASFMPKPLANAPGSAMHTHFSLFDNENNIFYDNDSEHNLSITGRRFIAGILVHAHEISAITNQFVNSYKRLFGGDEAPNSACWGVNNRSAMIRVPRYKLGKKQSMRIELRSVDTATNPYLAFSMILAAGMDGIEKKLDLEVETTDDVWTLTEHQRHTLGIKPLPNSLEQALKFMEESDFVAETLGEHIFDYFLKNKRDECERYNQQITQFETEYLFNKL
ncbi:MAG: type I glutamate--ammonia ligase [Candidatus Ancillula sp.]|nr:type I glutamate--ammonia ligase [Candidatus Ancillula sp.]